MGGQEERVLIERIYKQSTLSVIESVHSASAEIVHGRRSELRLVPLTEPRPLTSDQLDALRRLLLNPESHSHGKKRCLPRPAVLVRMESHDAFVTVVLDFSCTAWTIQAPKERRGSFFDPVRDDVLALVKELFPEYASPNKRSVWRADVIKQLIDAAGIEQE